MMGWNAKGSGRQQQQKKSALSSEGRTLQREQVEKNNGLQKEFLLVMFHFQVMRALGGAFLLL